MSDYGRELEHARQLEEAMLRELEHEAQAEEDELVDRWRFEALHDPTSDAYYSDGAREARIDAGLE